LDELIKRPFQKINYTAQQVQELQRCYDSVSGPIYFMTNFMKIQHPTKGELLFEPFDYQYDLINTYHNYRYSIAMCARQLGKTTVAAGYILWYAMFNKDTHTLIAAHKYSGALEIMDRLRYAYEGLPDHIRAGAREYNKKTITFDNGSKIEAQATTESTGRGKSISLLYLDEFAFVTPNIAREFWTAISPTLATGGKCMITSTPNTDEDQYANIWHDANKNLDEYGNPRKDGLGRNGFRPFLATWDEHPERDQKWASEEEAKIGTDRFAREHQCLYGEAIITLQNQDTGEIFETTISEFYESL
jgi:hypothetical protein